MPKQIGASEGFDSIVYTRTSGVIATPMCKCFYINIVWRPLCIANLNSDLDLAPSAITVVTNTAFASHVKCLWWN